MSDGSDNELFDEALEVIRQELVAPAEAEYVGSQRFGSAGEVALARGMLRSSHAEAGSIVADLSAMRKDRKHNRTYGPGPKQTYWTGALKDGNDRGPDCPYFCPEGWTRLGLKVDRPERMQGWNLVYHGTSQDGAKGIIENGMSRSRCDNGVQVDGQIAYFTPCIEYAAHPRYSRIKNSGSEKIQVVLQCRVRPNAVQTPRYYATLLEDQRTVIDSRYENESMEWITEVGPDNIIVYGLMVRKATDPSELPSSQWWTKCHSEFGQGPYFC